MSGVITDISIILSSGQKVNLEGVDSKETGIHADDDDAIYPSSQFKSDTDLNDAEINEALKLLKKQGLRPIILVSPKGGG